MVISDLDNNDKHVRSLDIDINNKQLIFKYLLQTFSTDELDQIGLKNTFTDYIVSTKCIDSEFLSQIQYNRHSSYSASFNPPFNRKLQELIVDYININKEGFSMDITSMSLLGATIYYECRGDITQRSISDVIVIASATIRKQYKEIESIVDLDDNS